MGFMRWLDSNLGIGVDVIDGKLCDYDLIISKDRKMFVKEVRVLHKPPSSDWQEHQHPHRHNLSYYYNRKTGECSLDKPEEWLTEEEKNPDNYWEVIKAKNGSVYYWNSRLKEVQLFKPDALKANLASKNNESLTQQTKNSATNVSDSIDGASKHHDLEANLASKNNESLAQQTKNSATNVSDSIDGASKHHDLEVSFEKAEDDASQELQPKTSSKRSSETDLNQSSENKKFRACY